MSVTSKNSFSCKVNVSRVIPNNSYGRWGRPEGAGTLTALTPQCSYLLPFLSLLVRSSHQLAHTHAWKMYSTFTFALWGVRTFPNKGMSDIWKLLLGGFVADSAGTTPDILEEFIRVCPWIQVSLDSAAMEAGSSPGLTSVSGPWETA